MSIKVIKSFTSLYRSKFKLIIACICLTTFIIGYKYVDITPNDRGKSYIKQQADRPSPDNGEKRQINGYAIYGSRAVKKSNQTRQNIIDLDSIDFKQTVPAEQRDFETSQQSNQNADPLIKKKPTGRISDSVVPADGLKDLDQSNNPNVNKFNTELKTIISNQYVPGNNNGSSQNLNADQSLNLGQDKTKKVMSNIFGGDVKPKREKLDKSEVLEMLNSLDKIVHLDLKGAPPKIEYYDQFIPFIKQHGAVGLLLEYEDTFPFEGELKDARHGLAYTLEDINHIKKLAKDNGLYIMPLVQTYGHLEWILKLKKFAHLRDSAEYPQVITPCLEESYTVIFDMLDQVIEQHKDAPYFHVGCDEVYYKLMHPNCSSLRENGDFTVAFMNHLVRVSAHVREKLPNAKIIFWDDMMHNMDVGSLLKYKPQLMKYEIEPMLWGYMENVRGYFNSELYVKYGTVFETIWVASAYKGATNELNVVTSVKHHYLNHVSWIDVMQEKVAMGIVRFRGIAITGWSRYDHFLALCDLLPVSIPSLVHNLRVMQVGELNEGHRQEISTSLGCFYRIPWTPEEIYEGNTCTFPGHEVYEAVISLPGLLKNFEVDFEYGKKYITLLNLNYNYVHKARGHEVIQKLQYDYRAMINFKKRFEEAGKVMYHEDTIAEWLLVYIIPQLDQLHSFLTKTKRALKETDWKPRPLPVTLKNYPDTI